MHTKRAGHDKRRAAHRLDQCLDHERIEHAALLTQEVQREPDLSGSEHPAGELPREASDDVRATRVHGAKRLIQA